jgi:hypothetical protein
MTNLSKIQGRLFAFKAQTFFCLCLGCWVLLCGLVLGFCSPLLGGLPGTQLGLWLSSGVSFLGVGLGQSGLLSWGAPSSSFLGGVFNPAADIDASAATDADDLVVFIADIFEFAEHEQALLLDSLTEVVTGGLLVGLGGISASLSIRSLKR